MNKQLSPDICIIGGGICGLWCLRLLTEAGYSCLLVEADRLGGGQTIASQGIIHSGLKYSLGGGASGGHTPTDLRDMPAYWRRCINGEGELDLRGVKVLANHVLMMAGRNLGADFTAYVASKLIAAEATPTSLTNSVLAGQLNISSQLYQLDDFVVDTQSLLQVLVKPVKHLTIQADCKLLEDGTVALSNGTKIHSSKVVLCAGTGNAALLESQADTVTMQRRPLHQVMVTGKLPDLHGHLVTAFSDKPRLTITSHPVTQDIICWYLGGELAESGVQRTKHEQIEAARSELADLLPGLPLDQMQFDTLKIDRAEPANHLQRPGSAFVEAIEHGFACWPVKLTLAPVVATDVMQGLATQLIPSHQRTDHSLPSPPVAVPPWLDARA